MGPSSKLVQSEQDERGNRYAELADLAGFWLSICLVRTSPQSINLRRISLSATQIGGKWRWHRTMFHPVRLTR
jgi:hypothetical protein